MLSLGIIWLAVGLVILLAVLQLVGMFTQKISQQYNDVEMKISTSESEGDLQPMSAKIVATGDAIGLETTISVADYAEVWNRLNNLTPASSSKEQKERAIVEFLDGLEYQAVGYGKEIVSKRTGDKVSPSTVMCYLNGYIPEKPYLKANCPA